MRMVFLFFSPPLPKHNLLLWQRRHRQTGIYGNLPGLGRGPWLCEVYGRETTGSVDGAIGAIFLVHASHNVEGLCPEVYFTYPISLATDVKTSLTTAKSLAISTLQLPTAKRQALRPFHFVPLTYIRLVWLILVTKSSLRPGSLARNRTMMWVFSRAAPWSGSHS